jgi:putative PIN family toxin of toxin-antitoxin system
VIDPGVLVSALIGRTGSPPDLIVRAALGGELEIVMSPHLIAELAGVLARSQFETQAGGGQADRYVAALVASAEVVEDPPEPDRLTPDPDDDYLVALARTANAGCLVSGDAHLTSLSDPDPAVLTPRQLVDRLGL